MRFLSLFNDYLELRSSSLTFGNASELSFLSLNHDLIAIFNVESLGGLYDALSIQFEGRLVVVLVADLAD